MKLIIGKKVGMDNLFTEEGRFVPVTVIKSSPNYITQIRNRKTDGYSALQIGFSETNKANKPQKEQFKKSNTPELRYLKEIIVTEEEAQKHKAGEKFLVNIFNKGDLVKVIGTSKGKGFQGVIKRHGFSRGPETHGSHHHREPGSIGAAYPQRIFKGQKLPGRMGSDQVTVKGLKIAGIDTENDIILIKGAVPGPNKSLIYIIGEGDFEGKVEIKEVKKTEKSLKNDKKTEKLSSDKSDKKEDLNKKKDQGVKPATKNKKTDTKEAGKKRINNES